MVKTQSSIEFQNSIFDLFLTHYLQRNNFEEGYTCSISYSESAFFSNLAGLKPLNFYSLS